MNLILKKVYYTLSKQNNVPDPYFGGKDGFIQVYEMLKEACQTINDEIKKGKLILIPCTLGETRLNKVLPQENTTYINTCSEFIVENIRSARRFLIKSNINTAIDDLNFHLLNKHTKKYELSFMLKSIYDGKNIGLLSEAGCPRIADPGAEIVKLAHLKNINIIPLVGPSSILMGLMASGLNGQNFAFNGYLPKDKKDRKKNVYYF